MSEQVDTTLVERLEALASEVNRQIAVAPAVQDTSSAERMVVDLRESAGLLAASRLFLELLRSKDLLGAPVNEEIDRIIERFATADAEPDFAP